MKKNLLLGIVSTIYAVILYVIGSTNPDTAYSILVSGGLFCFALINIGLFIVGIAGIKKPSRLVDALFSAAVVIIAAFVQYVLFYQTMVSWPLYYSVLTAFVFGLFIICFMVYIYKGLQSLNE